MTHVRERLEVARAMAKLTATPGGREYLKGNGYKSGTPVICVEYDDPIGEVLHRMSSYGGDRVVVAMLRDDELEVATFTASTKEDESSEVSRYSCIGMLLEAIARSRRTESFTFTDKLVGPQVHFGRPMKVSLPA